MNSSAKLIFCVAIIFCSMQLVVGTFDFRKLFYENVKSDLTRDCANVERDFERESENFKHKLLKESSKLEKKATKEGAKDCLDALRLSTEGEINDKSQELLDCVKELRNSLETDFKPDSSFRDVLRFRNLLRSKLNVCRGTTRNNVRNVMNDFFETVKTCVA